MVEARQLSNSLLRSKIIDYVVNRQNEDGGYTFCQGAESNVQDSYYGLAILTLLNSPFANAEKTYAFIAEDRTESIYSIYYASKASMLLGRGISGKLREQAASVIGDNRFFGSTESLPEISSEFATTYMALELAGLLGIAVEKGKVARWLLGFKNGDGGFGMRGQSNINSTYFAVASLSLLERDLDFRSETLKFIRRCEKPLGGFTVIPINYTPYMEHTYYGVMTLGLLGEKSMYPGQTVDWVLTCQNNKGGFARSDLGLATFQDTFYAVSLLQELAAFPRRETQA